MTDDTSGPRTWTRTRTRLQIRHDLFDGALLALRDQGRAKLAPQSRPHADTFLSQLNQKAWEGESFTQETEGEEIIFVRSYNPPQ